MNAGYSRLQILLHWVVVVFIAVQFLTGGSIERTHHTVHMGLQPAPWDIIEHKVHNACGILIGVLMGLRLVIRVVSGAPSAAATHRFNIAARLLHFALYVALIGQAALGFVASYISFSVAPLHVLGSWIILALVATHICAAVWHAMVLKDDTLDRMIFPKDTGRVQS